jgi:F-type H+-transporting ATPase subunit gamma
VTERLADIRARINGVRQLGAVVNAMRGIAAARVQQARSQLTAVDAYAGTIASSIGRVLSIIPADRPKDARESSQLALVLFCAEQGFAGAFSERVLNDVGDDLVTSSLFLIGTRGSVVASEKGLAADWQSAMPSHSPGVPKLANRIAEALYAHIAAGKVDRLDVVFSEWQPGRGIHVERRRLFPFDRARFPGRGTAAAMPLLNLMPDALLRELASDYLHAQICNAALHAFAAENQARMEAMAAARSQIELELSSLEATQRHIRQEEITAEIIELAAGETASRSDRDQAGHRARHQQDGPATPDVRSPPR